MNIVTHCHIIWIDSYTISIFIRKRKTHIIFVKLQSLKSIVGSHRKSESVYFFHAQHFFESHKEKIPHNHLKNVSIQIKNDLKQNYLTRN